MDGMSSCLIAFVCLYVTISQLFEALVTKSHLGAMTSLYYLECSRGDFPFSQDDTSKPTLQHVYARRREMRD